MIRKDFVSNSSSSSYIVSMTEEEFNNRHKNKTVLDIVLYNKCYDCSVLPPLDSKKNYYDRYYYNRPKDSKYKYDWSNCPYSEYISGDSICINKESIPNLKKYIECCKSCSQHKEDDGTECPTCIRMKKMLKQLEKGKYVAILELESTDTYTIDDQSLEDKRIIEYCNGH